ncbi:rCG63488 [Rattus norvegicus]|uniref:RCG63488 n=1 Tax=Rattus norvegicus TaxID=10116 RepID=A6HCR7_RAT|nr:rCG63488 [Rattus norvegicus]
MKVLEVTPVQTSVPLLPASFCCSFCPTPLSEMSPLRNLSYCTLSSTFPQTPFLSPFTGLPPHLVS